MATLATVIGGGNAQSVTDAVDQRRYVPLAFSVDTLIDGSTDASLGRPLMLAVSDSLVMYFDYADMHLGAVDLHGKRQWKVGRRGNGPGEWASPTSLVAAVGGGVVVHDGGTSRLVRVDAKGSITQNVQRAVRIERLGRLSNGQFIGFGGAGGRARAELLDSALQTVRAIPWSGWPDSSQGLGNQLRIANDFYGLPLAVSMYTGRIMPVHPGPSLDSGVDGIDPHPLPGRSPITGINGETVAAVPEGTKVAIRDAAVVGKNLFVLNAGADPIGGRTLDIYEVSSVRYRGSVRVPIELNVLSATTTALVATSNNPYPTIVRLRWDARALEAALNR